MIKVVGFIEMKKKDGVVVFWSRTELDTSTASLQISYLSMRT